MISTLSINDETRQNANSQRHPCGAARLNIRFRGYGEERTPALDRGAPTATAAPRGRVDSQEISPSRSYTPKERGCFSAMDLMPS